MLRKITEKEINDALISVSGIKSEEIFATLQESPSVSLCMLFSPLRKNAFEFLPVKKYDRILICDACMGYYKDVYRECERLDILESNEYLREILSKDSRNHVYESFDSLEGDAVYDYIVYWGNDRNVALELFSRLKNDGTYLSAVLLDSSSKFECIYLSPDALYPKAFSRGKDDGALVYLYGNDSDIPLYVKYSDERTDYRNIKTEIVKENSNKFVYKKSMSDTPGYLNEIYDNYLKIADKFKDVSGFRVVPASLVANSLMFPFVSGDNLSDILYKCFNEDRGNFKRYLKKFKDLVSYNKEAEFTDYDLIFSNIIVDDKGVWNIIDCEWCGPGNAPDSQILFRSLYNFGLEHGIEDSMLTEFYEFFDIDEELRKQYTYDEAVFQKRVTGGNLTTDELLLWSKTGICPVSHEMLLDIKAEFKSLGEIQGEEDKSFTSQIKGKVQSLLIKRCEQKYRNDMKKMRTNKTISFDVRNITVDIPPLEDMNRGMVLSLRFFDYVEDILSVFGEIYVPGQNNARYEMGLIISADGKKGLKIELPLNYATTDIEGTECSLRRMIAVNAKLLNIPAGEYKVYGYAFDKCSRQKIYKMTDLTFCKVSR